MNNETIANKLAWVAFKPKQENSIEFAMQLFIEKLLLPSGVEDYSDEYMEKLIFDKLNNLDDE